MRYIIIVLILLVFSLGQNAYPKDEVTFAEIEYLINYIDMSDCTFIRNGKEHTAKEAAKHVKRKYNHFKEQINTTEKFIELSATKSLLSSKPYLIKCPDKDTVKSNDWFLEELKRYRQDDSKESG